MANTVADCITRVKEILAIAGTAISPADDEVIRHLQGAAKRMSEIKPRLKATTAAGAGTRFVSLPSDFDSYFSAILEVEYPDGKPTPQIVHPTDYTIYRDSGTGDFVPKLEFFSATPKTTETVRLLYTIPHNIPTATTATTTIPDNDFEALCKLTAAYIALSQSGLYSTGIDPTNQADVVDFRSNADRWRDLAKAWEEDFMKLMQTNKEGTKAALAYGDLEARTQTGFQFIWKNTRKR